jgi:AcrR family transcriptional regulator
MSLRERKKALTRVSIEDVGLRMFLERGYEATTIDDICDAVLVSRRTFFRYFSSKEDVALASSRDRFAQAARRLGQRPDAEPLLDSLAALFVDAGAFFAENRALQLTRAQLLLHTPALAAGYLKVLTDFEHLIRDFVADRTDGGPDDRQTRLVAAATVTAFRVAEEAWVDGRGTTDLGRIARANLDQLLAGCLRQEVTER